MRLTLFKKFYNLFTKQLFNFEQKIAMKHLLIISAIFFVVSAQVSGQEKSKKDSPDEQTIVNKEYDENGNLIAYDSTYIHQWSSDSSFQSPFLSDDIFAEKDFPDMNDFFEGFFGDSAMQNFSFPNAGRFPSFDDEELLKLFGHSFTDSLFINKFSLDNDSSFNFNRNFEFPNIDELRERIKEQFKNQYFQSTEFKNQEQKEQWEKLMQKHQMEIEELQKKWEQKEDRPKKK